MGVGTWQWGDRRVWQYGGDYAAGDVRSAFDAALAAGLTFFDTAEIYGFGRSERFLGEFINTPSRVPGPAGAARLRIATKFFPMPWRLTGASLLRALRGSLRRLGLPAVDLYQIHWPSPLLKIENLMDALAEAVAVGLTTAVGVSNYDLAQTERAHAALARRGVPLASNQVHYSLLNRRIEHSGLLARCAERGITVIAYSPLEMGLLSGKYSPEHPPAGSRAGRYPPAYLASIQPLLARLRAMGAAHGERTPAQVALNWTLCKGTLPIPGAKNAQQVAQNAGALNWRLTPAEVAELDEATESL